jgi:D-alanine-D-alanine ligase
MPIDLIDGTAYKSYVRSIWFMAKEKLVIIFGGRSSEHEVSCISVQTVASAVDLNRYDATLVGITKDGRWLLVDSIQDIEDGSWRESKVTAVISPDSHRELLIVDGDKVRREHVDVIFPVLHGMYGEDGTIQGLFEMADIPYVGCGVLASAASMDKFYTKIIVDTLDVAQAKFVPVIKEDFSHIEDALNRVEAELDYPVFVKPSKAGSSKGVSKAVDRESLLCALNEAIKYDSKILVEETIVGRELECAVLGHGEATKASDVGEILAAAEFYDFDAKYNNSESKTVIGADIPEGVREEIRRDAVSIFRALDGFGLSRVDFFLEKETNRVVFNEINTLPGFTKISMYPMLWKDKGYDITTLVTTLVEMAKERYI